MKVAITGNTKGIGKALSEYFSNKNCEIIGFSKTDGYDISKKTVRDTILKQLDNFDIFVNNAYNNFDDSQELLLKDILDCWKDQEKIVINISSRWTDGDSEYCVHKRSLDQLCEKYKSSKVYIINLKPGLTDTPRVKKIKGDKMNLESIVSVIEFIFSNLNNFKVHSITFGK